MSGNDTADLLFAGVLRVDGVLVLGVRDVGDVVLINGGVEEVAGEGGAAHGDPFSGEVHWFGAEAVPQPEVVCTRAWGGPPPHIRRRTRRRSSRPRQTSGSSNDICPLI